MDPNGKRVLIIGSGGLGMATMTALLAKGCKVIGVDKRSGGTHFEQHIIVARTRCRQRKR